MSPGVSMAAATRSLIGRQGYAGFATGMGSSLALGIPSAAAYAALYVHMRDDFAHRLHKDQLRYAPALAAFTSRSVITLAFTPLEVARLQLQASEAKLEGGMRAAFRIAINKPPGGVRALFSGGLLSVLRDAPHSAIYWAGFDMYKAMLSQLRGDDPASPRKSSLAENLVGATLSGAVATVFTQPFDVLKTRKQVGHCGVVAARRARCRRRLLRRWTLFFFFFFSFLPFLLSCCSVGRPLLSFRADLPCADRPTNTVDWAAAY